MNLQVNSATSLVSDFCWAYSMLLTSPLVITVGLSLTIPLSLFGQMILNGQTSSMMYWIGAGVVFLSFVFINYESKVEEEESRPYFSSSGDSSFPSHARTNPTRSRFRKVWERISPRRQ